MKLYYAPAACSLAPHIAAVEAGLKIDLEKVTFGPTKTTESGADYLSINPKGAVPAMDVGGGEVLTEVAALQQYIASKAGDKSIGGPADGIGRWRFLETLNFIATELHKGFGPLWNPATPPDVREGAVANLGKKFDYLNRVLDGRDYLTGDKFTVADAYAFAVINWTNFHKIDLAPWQNIGAFMQRMRARPGVQQALQEEGLT